MISMELGESGEDKGFEKQVTLSSRSRGKRHCGPLTRQEELLRMKQAAVMRRVFTSTGDKALPPVLMRLVALCDSIARTDAVFDPCNLNEQSLEPIIKLASKEITKEAIGLLEPMHWTRTGMPQRKTGASKQILDSHPPGYYYFDIARSDWYSIGIFILPPGGSIPLHDHPRMSVVSKIVYGQLKAWSFDWNETEKLDENKINGGDATIVENGKVYSEGSVKLLLPKRGNLHQFYTPNEIELGEAACGCAILDIIMPPYDEFMGRTCTYYSYNDNQDAPHLLWDSDITQHAKSIGEFHLEPTDVELNIQTLT